MAKVLVSFVIGLAVAAFVISLSNREPASVFLERSASTASHESVETSDPGTESGSPNVMPDEFATDSESDELEESVDQRSTNERPPPELPIDLPAEFHWVAESPQRFFAFDSFQRQPYDVDWAPAMEAHLSEFLKENPEITQTYGYPIINCRTTQCELAFVAYGLDTTLDLDDVNIELLGHFADSISGFFDKPEFEQFYNPSHPNMIFLDHRTENGVTSMLWELVSIDRLSRPESSEGPE